MKIKTSFSVPMDNAKEEGGTIPDNFKLPEHDHLQITPLCLLQRGNEREKREAFICGSSKKSPKEKKWSVCSITNTHSK